MDEGEPDAGNRTDLQALLQGESGEDLPNDDDVDGGVDSDAKQADNEPRRRPDTRRDEKTEQQISDEPTEAGRQRDMARIREQALRPGTQRHDNRKDDQAGKKAQAEYDMRIRSGKMTSILQNERRE